MLVINVLGDILPNTFDVRAFNLEFNCNQVISGN